MQARNPFTPGDALSPPFGDHNGAVCPEWRFPFPPRGRSLPPSVHFPRRPPSPSFFEIVVNARNPV
ncbi:Hypothetical predicted protein [Podarcis lilfordi]|uniref:Uncharacterized protein n=1 Tax=Podarcis lilfordi TaxID=74358 RepID=A0AA35KLN1_9SAUR|nr:Hypothetical predicted protein [Podarcis lilfordi]